MRAMYILLIVFMVAAWSDGLAQADAADGALNAVYGIVNQAVQLVDGRAESEAAPGSVIKTITIVVGKPVCGDLDGDGNEDAALFLSQDLGGSGTFFYVAAAMFNEGRWQGTNAVLVGDRVVPGTISIRSGVVTARYADRMPEQPMAQKPSVAKTLNLKLVNGRLEAIQPRSPSE
ncbi:MAG: hypothetical protein JSW39_21485 [Desulfobacterales bacterium]|nr:MAG: hypothetical protein JSW39_21485 [Desulfobacterales bacterium]